VEQVLHGWRRLGRARIVVVIGRDQQIVELDVDCVVELDEGDQFVVMPRRVEAVGFAQVIGVDLDRGGAPLAVEQVGDEPRIVAQ